jgi:predicted NBD/HSP70 family sugar kinase
MYILIDIGGTKTRVAITEHREAFLEPIIFSTPQNFEEWFVQFTEATTKLLQGKKVHGVIAGVPCTLGEDRGTIRHAPHLQPWEGTNLKGRIEERFSCQCILQNDTALVGLGEATFGAGKGYPIVAYITISTGVNGARITDGKIDKTVSGFEIGHTIIEDNKPVEAFIAGSALEARFGRPSREVHDVKLWEEVNHYAGILGANTTMYWSPSVIVYGGPVMNDLHIEIIEREAKQIATVYDKMPVFVRGTLKDFGGLYGALALSKEIVES